MNTAITPARIDTVPALINQAETSKTTTTIAETKEKIRVWIVLVVSPRQKTKSEEERQKELERQNAEVATVRGSIEEFILQHDPQATFWPTEKGNSPTAAIRTDIDREIFRKIRLAKPDQVEAWGTVDNVSIVVD